ncbi:hypothetical protein FHT77_000987 [Rhizobium sp. BK181]|uniref:hypothetical protein n=1 Tax=Rhizobium sp. BK181 TaxID=2587072 RepID=UPI001611BEC3|nr:hypothetical protein [Rhizobium sp. BK181]MBB3315145.1 hypothetical protein [Rhizobium sp. BK181]
MSEGFQRVLTEYQGEVADAIIAVLRGVEVSDALPAICSLLAATINTHAPTHAEAYAVAEGFGDQLLDLVELGQADQLRMAR